MKSKHKTDNNTPFSRRSVDYYIELMDSIVYESLNGHQKSEVRRVLAQAIPKPSPKIVDLRFVIDLIFSRFYIVVFAGKDRRKSQRKYKVENNVTRLGNFFVVIFLLICINILVSLTLFFSAYLVKSAIGINLFHGASLSDILNFW